MEEQYSEEDEQFLHECQAKGVDENFLNEWLDFYFNCLDAGIPLPPMPWYYQPIGRLGWTPKLTRTNPEPLTDDDREEILLLVQYQ